MKKCNNCGEILPDTAKFCKKCGTKVESIVNPSSEISPVQNNFTLLGSYIHWNVLDGQIAVKIDEKDVAAYGKVKGLQVQDGVKALFFVEGKLVAELEGGSYSFREMGVSENSPHVDKLGLVRRFFNRVVGFFSSRGRERAEAAGLSISVNANVPRVSIVLIRDTKFPLLFDLKDMPTANLHSDVVLHALCKISNINEFYRALLLDKKFVCYEEFSEKIDSLVQMALRNVVANVLPNQIVGNMTLYSEVLQKLQDIMTQVYPFVTVTDVLDMSASREDLDKIRKLREELYISELELEQLTKRNDFLNRLKNENNAQLLREARTQVDFVDAMAKIDEQNELSKFEHEKFAALLYGQHKIHEAKTGEELEAALQEIRKSELLRENEFDAFNLDLKTQKILRDAKNEDDVDSTLLEYRKNGLVRDDELETLQHNIRHRVALRDAGDEQVLAMATIQNEQTQERQKMLWEFEVGQKRLENELQLHRTQDAYNDERRQKDDEYGDIRREKDFDFNTRVRQATMDQDYLDASRNSDLEIKEQAARTEMAIKMRQAVQQHEMEMEHRHKEEMRRMFQTMTVEQIMAANPDLTPAAAEALKAKFTAEAAVTAEKYKAEAAFAQNGKLETIMQNVLQTTREDRAAEIERMLQANNMNNANMQQLMQMFAQMSSVGMQSAAGANAVANGVNVQHQSELVDIYKQQAAHAHSDSQKENDRMLQGMQTTIRAVVDMKSPQGSQNSNRKNFDGVAAETAARDRKCQSCGALLEEGSSFCEECGASV